MEQEVQIKPPVEVRYRKELEALQASDTGKKPINWKLSPRAVRTFILGSREPLVVDGEEIPVRKKYLGNDALVERCIITLAGNRGLMLVGEPGTAKTMLSELRMAFGYFTPLETDRIAGKAAALHGGSADRILKGREVSPLVYEYGEALDAWGRLRAAEMGKK